MFISIVTWFSPSINLSYTGWFKKMSPLAFKPNNLQLMRCTTLPDTAFERADNFLSNECIHALFPFQITSSQAANQKFSGFCVFRFQTNFAEREHFVLSSLYRNIAFLWSVNCAQDISVHQSLNHLLISLEPVLKSATAAGYASV